MDMIEMYETAARRNTDRIAALDPAQLHAPTPCAEWDLSELLAHLIGGNRMFAAAMGNPVAGTTDLSTDIAELAHAHSASATAVGEALRSAGAMERQAQLPIGTVPGHMVVGLALVDAVVHGWDLAKASGQDTSLDDALAETLLASLTTTVTPEMRKPDGAMAVFGPPVPVEDTASAEEKLVAFLGRNPHWNKD